jgi:hypothetical protein
LGKALAVGFVWRRPSCRPRQGPGDDSASAFSVQACFSASGVEPAVAPPRRAYDGKEGAARRAAAALDIAVILAG